MKIDPKMMAEIIGEGVHTGLRKLCESPESYKGWIVINEMPDEEWEGVCMIVAKEVIKAIDGKFLHRNENECQEVEDLNNEDACQKLRVDSGQFPYFEQYRKT